MCVDIPPEEQTVEGLRGTASKVRTRYTPAEQMCKAMIKETWEHESMGVQRLSREFIMYKKVTKVQEDAPRIILCYPDGTIYKKYKTKVVASALMRDMSSLLARINKEASRRSQKAAEFAKKWEDAVFRKLTLEARIKAERELLKNSKQKDNPRLKTLEESLQKIEADIAEYQRLCKC